MFGLRKRKQQANADKQLQSLISEAESVLQTIASGGLQPVDRTAELARGRAELDRFVASVNQSLAAQVGSGMELVAHSILPEVIWTNPAFDDFLFKNMTTTPFDPWNTVLVGASDMTSMVMDLPIRPDDVHSDDVLKGHMIFGDIEREMKSKGVSGAAYHDLATRHLYVHAMRMGAERLGREPFIRSRSMFHHDGPTVQKVLS